MTTHDELRERAEKLLESAVDGWGDDEMNDMLAFRAEGVAEAARIADERAQAHAARRDASKDKPEAPSGGEHAPRVQSSLDASRGERVPADVPPAPTERAALVERARVWCCANDVRQSVDWLADFALSELSAQSARVAELEKVRLMQVERLHHYINANAELERDIAALRIVVNQERGIGRDAAIEECAGLFHECEAYDGYDIREWIRALRRSEDEKPEAGPLVEAPESGCVTPARTDPPPAPTKSEVVGSSRAGGPMQDAQANAPDRQSSSYRALRRPDAEQNDQPGAKKVVTHERARDCPTPTPPPAAYEAAHESKEAK